MQVRVQRPPVARVAVVSQQETISLFLTRRSTQLFDAGIDFVMFARTRYQRNAGICKHPSNKSRLTYLNRARDTPTVINTYFHFSKGS